MQELVSGGCEFCSILYLCELEVIGEDFGPQLSLLRYDQAAASRSIQGSGRKWRPTFSYPFVQRSIFWTCAMHHALSYMWPKQWTHLERSQSLGAGEVVKQEFWV